MRIFVNDFNYSSIFDISKIFECFLVGLLREIMHHNHFEVVLSVGETDQVPDPSMRLHDQIHQLFIDRVCMCR